MWLYTGSLTGVISPSLVYSADQGSVSEDEDDLSMADYDYEAGETSK